MRTFTQGEIIERLIINYMQHLAAIYLTDQN